MTNTSSRAAPRTKWYKNYKCNYLQEQCRYKLLKKRNEVGVRNILFHLAPSQVTADEKRTCNTNSLTTVS